MSDREHIKQYKQWGSLDGVEVIGKVLKVHDGDTVHVLAPVGEAGGYYVVKCRLSGINAPELKVNTSAKEAMIQLCNETNNVVTCRFGKKEKYGRTLAELFGSDLGKSHNQKMIDIGEAVPYSC